MIFDRHLYHWFLGGVEDGRMEGIGSGAGGLGAVYGGGRSHSSSSSSASPPHGQAAMLVVPHPLTTTKDQHHVVTQNGSGRKYQCKMCPSVSSTFSSVLFWFAFIVDEDFHSLLLFLVELDVIHDLEFPRILFCIAPDIIMLFCFKYFVYH